jgi:hypothetical protein
MRPGSRARRVAQNNGVWASSGLAASRVLAMAREFGALHWSSRPIVRSARLTGAEIKLPRRKAWRSVRSHNLRRFIRGKWRHMFRSGAQRSRRRASPIHQTELHVVIKLSHILVAFLLATASPARNAAAQTPPAPMPIEPASGAALAQPMTLRWSPVTDPRGPVANYTWQLGTTSSFTVVVASGFTDERDGTPIPTFARVSGVPNGTYFWRVKTTVTVGGTVGFADSAWSAVRTVTITGPGPAPGTPSFTAPANGSRFHVREFFDIKWTAVANAQYYLLEGDDDPNFSAPQTLNVDPMQFGTTFHAGWGNALPNIYYRVRAVSIDNVRGLPSATLNVKVVNTAPVPPAPTPQSPIGGAVVSLPFMFDWSDTANPQVAGYDVDVDTDPNFAGAFGVALIQGISRSDYTIVSDLPPGNYFWRVRALHGDAFGPWSAGVGFRVVAAPPTPPGLELAWIITEPGTTYGGASTQARVTLNGPAPAGGASVRIISDMPNVEVPQTAFIPAGATDVMVAPITTPAVHGATVGPLRASYGPKWQQSSLGMFPLVFSLALNTDAVVGGTPVTGTVTLQRPALAGGISVTLVSADTSLVRPPARVVVPEGETAVNFPIATSPVAAATPIAIDTGTANDGYRAPQTVLMLVPVGAPAAAPSLASVTLASASVIGGGTTTGTVTLTRPAPAGGAAVWINGSLEGRVVTPPGVTIPAGSTSATFTITAPDVNASQWVMIQAAYGNANSGQFGAVLRVDPGRSATPAILALTVDAPSVIGGQPVRGLIGLATPSPAGGTTIVLSSDNPAVRVPASVVIAAGNSATTFIASTNAVTDFNSASITASTAAGSKSVFLSVFPDPNAPPTLASLTPNVGGVNGGATLQVSLTLSAAAPAGGAVVRLTSSNTAAARVPASVTVPAGQAFATFNVTTSPVAADTAVTITGTYGLSRTATITVLGTPGGPGAAAVDIALSGVPATIRRGQTFTATATVTNGGSASASGYSVAVSVTPADAMKLQTPTNATQPVATVVSHGSQAVSWQIRGEKAKAATITMTLRDASGATIKTVQQAITVTN